MKKQLKDLMSLIVMILIGSTALAASVKRIVIVPRQPDLYVRDVHTALNTNTGQTLVIWRTHLGVGEGFSIWGQLLQPDGKPIGSRFQIIRSSSNPRAPSVVYNPDANQFVLVYSKVKFTEFEEVYAIRLKPTGRPKGKPVLVSHPHNPAFKIFNMARGIFYHSENKSILILFERYEEGPPDPADPKGIYGVILGSDLSFRKRPVFVQPIETGPGVGYGPFISDVQFHEPSGKLLLGQTLTIPVNFRSECLLTQIDPALRKPPTVLKIDKDLEDSFCGVRFMKLPNGQMISLFARDDGTRKRRINSQGSPSGPNTAFFSEPLRNFPLGNLNGSGFSGPAFTSSNTSKEFAVLGFTSSEIEQAQFWLQRANAKGKAVGPAIEIESGVDSFHGGIISSLPFTPLEGHLYAVLYIEGERDQPPLVNQGSGLVLLLVNTAH